MRCIHCNNELPNDSRFCQFCGKALSYQKTQSYRKAQPTYTVIPMPENAFCRRCGKPLDDAKRCTGCGKHYFRGIQPAHFLCIVLMLAMLALAILCVVQGLYYDERLQELEQLLSMYHTTQ